MEIAITILSLTLAMLIAALLRIRPTTDRLREQALEERWRKEKALALLQSWAQGISREMRISREVVEELNDVDAHKALVNNQSFALTDSKTRNRLAVLILACVGISCDEDSIGDFLPSEKVTGNWIIPQSISITINAHISAYLNMTEVILLAVEEGIADRHMILKEFRPVVSRIPESSRKHRMCELYRNQSGDSFPAIERFVKSLENSSPSLATAV